ERAYQHLHLSEYRQTPCAAVCRTRQASPLSMGERVPSILGSAVSRLERGWKVRHPFGFHGAPQLRKRQPRHFRRFRVDPVAIGEDGTYRCHGRQLDDRRVKRSRWGRKKGRSFWRSWRTYQVPSEPWPAVGEEVRYGRTENNHALRQTDQGRAA